MARLVDPGAESTLVVLVRELDEQSLDTQYGNAANDFDVRARERSSVMDDHALDRSVPTGDDHLYRRRRSSIDSPVVSRGAASECGVRPGGVDGREASRLDRRWFVAQRVHAAILAMRMARSNHSSQFRSGNSERVGVIDPEDAVTSPCESGELEQGGGHQVIVADDV